ncbi:MAG: glutaredoxin family protein [Proteobacteria bacterium]|nr:glutaredoxin family protein [Pseudomonadota bacterium]
MTRQLTLLTRAYCHLCDDMRAALAPLVAGCDVTVVELDVDADPALEARYGDDVPALVDGAPGGGRLLARWRLDPAAVSAVAAALATAAASPRNSR